jgi:nitroreductase
MDVNSAVITRRNIRKFKADPVDEKQILSWLEAASYAPNHRMSEPWEVLFIGNQTREKLNHKTNFGDAPTVLAFLAKTAETELDRHENLIAASCFVQNFQLLAWEAGVGVRWTSIGASAENRKILLVPDGYVVIGILGIGYSESIPQPKPRAPITEKIRYLD